MKDNYDDQVRMLALDLPEGVTKNGERCPKCGGGVHGDRAFSITREGDGTLKFICFRASCGFRGKVSSSPSTTTYSCDGQRLGAVSSDVQGNTGSLRNTPAKGGRSISESATRSLTSAERQDYRGAYRGTSDSHLQKLRKFKMDGSIGIPFYDTYRRMVGYNRRQDKRLGWDGKGRKSVIEFVDEKPPTTGDFYYCQGKTDTVVIVEDQISADCINNICGVDTFAIMGSHISDDVVLKLKDIGYRRLVLAMDADAWGKADKFEQKYRLLGMEAIRWNSGLDPKDMQVAELYEVFGD